MGRTCAEGPIKILVVDDERDVAQAVKEVLEDEGYGVVTARHGGEALEILSRECVDAVLLDLMMPVLDGVETCERMMHSPSLCEIPVIVMSAALDRLRTSDCRPAGLLRKPFELDNLFQAVEQAVARSSRETADAH